MYSGLPQLAGSPGLGLAAQVFVVRLALDLCMIPLIDLSIRCTTNIQCAVYVYTEIILLSHKNLLQMPQKFTLQ